MVRLSSSQCACICPMLTRISSQRGWLRALRAKFPDASSLSSAMARALRTAFSTKGWMVPLMCLCTSSKSCTTGSRASPNARFISPMLLWAAWISLRLAYFKSSRYLAKALSFPKFSDKSTDVVPRFGGRATCAAPLGTSSALSASRHPRPVGMLSRPLNSRSVPSRASEPSSGTPRSSVFGLSLITFASSTSFSGLLVATSPAAVAAGTLADLRVAACPSNRAFAAASLKEFAALSAERPTVSAAGSAAIHVLDARRLTGEGAVWLTDVKCCPSAGP
mmetsp:Transcript_31754/g.87732  ORF Transcript_31754/g.87732 Transcript_31754/m.87732 type:complete len:278 (-) Transcript_31754:203-1036(-)